MSASRIEIEVLYFAAARDVAGVRSERLALDAPASVASALDAIVRAHPALDAHRRQLRVAVNEAFADADHALAAGDVLALIPPVAGG